MIGTYAPVTRSRALSAVAILLLLAACSGTSSRPPGARVGVHLVDFEIHASTTTVPAGSVTFHIYNGAPATHEFVVVRTDAPAAYLPLARDGLSVDEDQLTSAGELPELDTRTTHDLTLTLTPGRYVFFCNMDGHYLGGMHGALDVTDG